MPSHEGYQTKVHYSGESDDFIVFVESIADYKKWKGDSSVPLAQVVDSFTVFCTHRHGAQGTLDRASKTELENEFGTKNEDDIIKKILLEGKVEEVKNNPRRYAERNILQGGTVAH